MFVGERASKVREDQEEEEGVSTLEDLQEEGVLRYLEGVVRLGCDSPAVHNHLLTLLAELEDEVPLFRYLTNLKSPPPLDLDFALLVILRTNRHHRSAVKVYVAQGKRSEAVELALKVDPGLAREICGGPDMREVSVSFS